MVRLETSESAVHMRNMEKDELAQHQAFQNDTRPTTLAPLAASGGPCFHARSLCTARERSCVLSADINAN